MNEAEEIVRALATCQVEEYQEYPAGKLCVCCRRFTDEATHSMTEPAEHESSCPWRRAVDYVAAHPRPARMETP